MSDPIKFSEHHIPRESREEFTPATTGARVLPSCSCMDFPTICTSTTS
jgi:hypothetical protein